MHKLTPERATSWRNEWYDTSRTGGRFVRCESNFRNWVTADGSAGPTGEAGFAAQSGRYHVYLSLACPWAHRTLIMRKLKNLEKHISISNARPYMGPLSWSFEPDAGRLFRHEGADDYYVEYLYEIYRLEDPAYDSRATVPVLWDKKFQRIVSNESADIMRMFNSAFDDITGNTLDFCPAKLLAEIDAWNSQIYPAVNNGVYRAGFATTQEAYEEAVYPLFAMLDRLEQLMGTQRYLCGNMLTEADIRLFPTLVRFDAVYHGHFKCNIRRICDYPNLWAYTRDIYQLPGIAETVDIDYNKAHYYGSHDTVNPSGVIPAGPDQDFLAPHDRAKF